MIRNHYRFLFHLLFCHLTTLKVRCVPFVVLALMIYAPCESDDIGMRMLLPCSL